MHKQTSYTSRRESTALSRSNTSARIQCELQAQDSVTSFQSTILLQWVRSRGLTYFQTLTWTSMTIFKLFHNVEYRIYPLITRISKSIISHTSLCTKPQRNAPEPIANISSRAHCIHNLDAYGDDFASRHNKQKKARMKNAWWRMCLLRSICTLIQHEQV